MKNKILISDVVAVISTILLLYLGTCALEIGYKSIRPEFEISKYNVISNCIIDLKEE